MGDLIVFFLIINLRNRNTKFHLKKEKGELDACFLFFGFETANLDSRNLPPHN